MRLSETALKVSLTIHKWNPVKHDRKASAEVAQIHSSDQNMGRYNKYLVDKDAPVMKAVSQAEAAARTTHYTLTLPWQDEGWRLLPIDMHQEYCDKMNELERAYMDAARAVSGALPDLKNAARSKLNGLWDEADYPANVMECYGFVYKFEPVADDTKDFRIRLNDEIISAMGRDIEARAARAGQEAMKDAWQRLHTAISNVVERLSTKDAIFRDSLIGNVTELCDILPKLNFTKDPELTRLCNEAFTKIAVCNPQDLRKDYGHRQRTAEEAAGLLRQIEAKGFL